MLIVVYFAFGVKIIFRHDSALNGYQAVLAALLLVVIVWITFIAGLNADESHHYLEYEKILETRLVEGVMLPNIYTYHTLPNVILTSLTALSLLIGLYLYSEYKTSQEDAKKELILKSDEHIEWLNSLHEAMINHRVHFKD